MPPLPSPAEEIGKLSRLRDRLTGRSREGDSSSAGDDMEALLQKAAAREASGDLSGAVESLTAALAGFPEHVEANRRLAALLERMGDMAGAVLCWRRVLAAGIDDPEVMTRFGIALSGNGQHDEAVGVLTNVAVSSPAVSAVHANLGMALLAAGRLREAEAAFGRALARDPRSAQAHCGLGLAYQKQRRWAEAARAFETTETLAPDNPVGPLNLGLALDALGDADGARRALLRAAALAPDDQEIRAAIEGLQKPPPPRPGKREADSSINGDLTSFPLPEVLEFLRHQGKSGTLMVISGRQQGVITLVRGAITDAEVAVAGAPPRKPVPPPTREIALQGILAAIQQMLAWTEGSFAYQRQEHPPEPPALAFDPQQLMLEALRIRDERKKPAPRR